MQQTSINLKHKYSDQIQNKKIIIVGPYPPPLGGVAVHVKRVIAKLENQQNNISLINTAIKSKNFIVTIWNHIKNISSLKPNIVFYHEPTESLKKFFLFVLLKKIFKYNLIVIDHDCRYFYKSNKLITFLYNQLFKHTNKQILIGTSTHQSYKYNKISLKNYEIESPYLPPDITTEHKILQTYPVSLFNFLNSHSPLLAANAFKLVLIDNIDLYGFDMCINLIKKLKNNFPKIGLILALANVDNLNYFHFLQKQIKSKQIKNNIYFLIGQKEFWPLLKKVDLFLRPTLSDSYGISIEEAISVGTKTLASNVCTRPRGTILFENRNIFDLINKTKQILSDNTKAKNQNINLKRKIVI